MEKSKVSEFEKFDAKMRTILSVSREELQKREAEWKRNHKKKRWKSKTSAAGRASSGKV